MVTVTLEMLHQDLEFLKKELLDMKKHMIDSDTILTYDDVTALEEYHKQKKEETLTSHNSLKKELGL